MCFSRVGMLALVCTSLEVVTGWQLFMVQASCDNACCTVNTHLHHSTPSATAVVSTWYRQHLVSSAPSVAGSHREALRCPADVTVVVYDEARHAIYTGNRAGWVHKWSPGMTWSTLQRMTATLWTNGTAVD